MINGARPFYVGENLVICDDSPSVDVEVIEVLSQSLIRVKEKDSGQEYCIRPSFGNVSRPDARTEVGGRYVEMNGVRVNFDVAMQFMNIYRHE